MNTVTAPGTHTTQLPPHLPFPPYAHDAPVLVLAAPVDPTKVVARRTASYVIDVVLLLMAIPVLLLLARADFTTFTDGPTCSELEQAGHIDAGWTCTGPDGGRGVGITTAFRTSALVAPAVWIAAYAVGVLWLIQGCTGATVGKLAVGIRTVDEFGRPPGIARQGLRGLAGVGDLFPWVVWGVPVAGLVTMAVTRGHQRFADVVTRTWVVRADHAGTAAPTPAGSATWMPYGPDTAQPW